MATFDKQKEADCNKRANEILIEYFSYQEVGATIEAKERFQELAIIIYETLHANASIITRQTENGNYITWDDDRRDDFLSICYIKVTEAIQKGNYDPKGGERNFLAFVANVAHNQIKNYYTTLYKKELNTISSIKDEEGVEHSIVESLPDTKNTNDQSRVQLLDRLIELLEDFKASQKSEKIKLIADEIVYNNKLDELKSFKDIASDQDVSPAYVTRINKQLEIFFKENWER